MPARALLVPRLADGAFWRQRSAFAQLTSCDAHRGAVHGGIG